MSETRLRRLRATPAIRSLIQENRVTLDDLIYPLFAVEGTGIRLSLIHI